MRIAEDSVVFWQYRGVYFQIARGITSKILYNCCFKHTVMEIQMFAEVYQLFKRRIAGYTLFA